MKNWIKAITLSTLIIGVIVLGIRYDFIHYVALGFIGLTIFIAIAMFAKELFDAWDSERGKRR